MGLDASNIGRDTGAPLVPGEIAHSDALQKGGWTFAFDFNIELKGGDPNRMGPAQKMATLREFASQTKGKPITIVAQTVMDEQIPPGPVPQGKDPQEPGSAPGAESGKASVAEPGSGSGRTQPVLVRYLIRDGEIQTLAVSKPGTFQEDLSGLLDTALQQSNGKKLGLVINDHGDDGAGLQGKDGFISWSQFDAAVQGSLSKVGRTSLDLVDLDSCLGGNKTVLDHVHPYADQLVASEAYERGTTQTHSAWLADLAANPQMNGNQLAEAIVDEAKKGNYTAYGVNQIDTIAHYNLKDNYEPFHQAMNSFADALAKSASDPRTKDALDKVISDSREHTSIFMFPLLDQYDLDLSKLTDNVLKNIDTVDDAQHSLRNSAEQLRSAQQGLVQSFYGSSEQELANVPAGKTLTGLSVFLPSRNDSDTRTESVGLTAIGAVANAVNPALPLAERKAQLPSLGAMLERQVEPLAQGNIETHKALEPIRQAVDQLSQPGLTDEQFDTLERTIYRQSLEVVDMPPFGASQNYFKLQLDTEIQEHLNGELPASPWARFLSELGSRSTVDTSASWQRLLEATAEMQRLQGGK
jgi:hypothetical protein